MSQVEHWLEKLHDKRHSLDVDCHERKTMLEKRLTISLLVTDLDLLENILAERRSSLDRIKNHLGDSQYECSKFTEVNANLVTEAKDVRDQALRVVKATEQLGLTKGFMEDDYKLKAYKLLEMATEYLEDLNRREQYLDAAMKFFESAEKVIDDVHINNKQSVLRRLGYTIRFNFEQHICTFKILSYKTTKKIKNHVDKN